MPKVRKEGAVLLSLSVLLCGVFVCSVCFYDRIEKETESGVLSVFAADVRALFQENETVTAFLGLPKAEEVSAAADIEPDAKTALAAERYIAYYNGIYQSLS